MFNILETGRFVDFSDLETVKAFYYRVFGRNLVSLVSLYNLDD